jgi:hypothetical protein
VINLTKWLYDLRKNTPDYTILEPDGEERGAKRFRLFPKQTVLYAEDATFVKLREATLSVDLPASLVRNLWSGARYVRASVSGRNLLTFTGYTGFDPEVSNFGAVGIGRNVDVAPFPPSRSFWFSVDVGF